uniref:Rab-GAP TBC domain-containing protein n=1 Tax=Arcella intermedia TaxID=1963864 RepID=A0A6B2LF78_9EUKA
MIANNWGSFKELDKTKHKKLHTKVKLGLPSALRGIIWTRLSKSIDAVIPGKYNELLQQRTANTNSNLCPIEKDSPRAFPYHPFFLNEGQTKLQNVLLAYANRNPELGYMSGMHLITAILLFNMDEENAFWMLDTLMKDYQIEGFFLGNREILINAMKQLSHYLENNIPELWEHFVRAVYSFNLTLGLGANRYYLEYHSPAQLIVGGVVGLVIGKLWSLCGPYCMRLTKYNTKKKGKGAQE